MKMPHYCAGDLIYLPAQVTYIDNSNDMIENVPCVIVGPPEKRTVEPYGEIDVLYITPIDPDVRARWARPTRWISTPPLKFIDVTVSRWILSRPLVERIGLAQVFITAGIKFDLLEFLGTTSDE